MVLKIRYFFHIFYTPDSCENHPYWVFLAEFSESEVKSHDSDVFGTYWENIDFRYRLLISFLRVIRASDCDLKYHFGPKVLEYGRKKLYLQGFLQLVFDMISPLLVYEYNYYFMNKVISFQFRFQNIKDLFLGIQSKLKFNY
jgi:hypothetical protein